MRGRRLVAAPAALALAAGALAQGPAPDDDVARLVAAKRAAAAAEARAATLQRESARAGDEATRARTEAAALALRVAAAEQDLAVARARIALVTRRQAEQRRGIAARQGPILHLLAALQTMARRPPALAVAQPGSVDDLVHIRLLLADTMPVVAHRTAGLRDALARATRLRAASEQAALALGESRLTLAARRRALATLEATAIRRSQLLAERAADEAQRALGLGAEARDLADRLDVQRSAAEVRLRLARLPDPPARPDERGAALPVHAGRPRYRLPMTGAVETGTGEVSPSGVRARGLTLAVAPGASVVAPAWGTVLFARAFRSYGTVVILAHGGGWTTTLTGLSAIDVRAGDRVRQGTVIGRAGDGRPAITAELRRGGRPVDVLAMAQAG